MPRRGVRAVAHPARVRGEHRAARQSRAPRRGRRLPLDAGAGADTPPRMPRAWPRRSPSRRVACSRSPSRRPACTGRCASSQDAEQATWMCFLSAYLSPLEDDRSLRRDPPGARGGLARRASCRTSMRSRSAPAPPTTPRGATPRCAPTCSGRRAGAHQAACVRGRPRLDPLATLRATLRAAHPARASARMGRYELLVTLGRIGLYELRARGPVLHERPGRRARRPRHARRQARLRDRRAAAPRAPRAASWREAMYGAGRSARPRARQLGGRGACDAGRPARGAGPHALERARRGPRSLRPMKVRPTCR